MLPPEIKHTKKVKEEVEYKIPNQQLQGFFKNSDIYLNFT